MKGTAKGVATDFDGNYEIQAQQGDVLEVSFIGFQTQTKKVTEGKSLIINIILKEDAQQLDDVIVVGYGTARRRDLTGAITSVKPTQELAATTHSFDNLLQGKVAGVNIASSGSTPGAASSIIIRGANSLTGDSQPLYVIDNVPQTSTGQTMANASGDFQLAQDPLAGLNPNDIVDIQILKDASATAIYGSRGANGVIIITTKRGQEGKAKITYSTNLTMAQATNLMPLMNLTQYANYFNTILPGEKAFDIQEDKVFYKYQFENEAGVLQETTEEIRYRDWMNEALRTAFSTAHNLNVNGGTQKVRYNISAGFKNIDGIVHNTGLKHGDFRINLGADLTDKLTVNLIASGFLRKNNMMSGGNTVGRTTGAIIPTAMNSAPYLLPSRDRRNEGDAKTTVLSWISDYEDNTDEYRFSLSGDATYKMNNNFSYTLRSGGNLNHVERTNWYGLALFKGEQENGFLSKSILDRNNYNIENLVNYNQTFGAVNVSATLGVTYDAYRWLNTSSKGTDFPYYVLRSNGLHVAKSVVINGQHQSDYQLLSYLGRANVSLFNGRYVVTGTIRADGTSKFSKENRWAYFPSFALAWNLHQEDFLQDSDLLSQLKLRAGYGETGSQNISPYVTVFGYGTAGGYADPNGNIIKGLSVSVNNPDLRWETTSSVNAGLDFGLLKNRINGSVEIYQKTTKDLLVNIALPGSTSFGAITINNGEISNRGIEAALNVNVVSQKDFTWNVGANIAINKSKIGKLGVPNGAFGSVGKDIKAFLGNTIGDHFGEVNIFAEGYAPGLFYGYKTNGIVQEAEESEYASKLGSPFNAASNGKAGNLKYVDENLDGKINSDDRTIIGDPNPDFVYGFQTSLRYKKIRLSAIFSGVKGGDILNAYNRYQNMLSKQNGTSNLNPEAFEKAWTPTNTNTDYPAYTSNVVNGIINDRYVEDGSYLRCTDITLGYDFSSEVLEKIKVQGINLYFSVKNAFTISNYSGFDVTSRSFNLDPLRRGIDIYSFPTQRAFIFGTNITF